MTDVTRRRWIRRYFSSGEVRELEDEVICEHRLKIQLDGRELTNVMLTPSLLEEYVLGFLMTRGLIGSIDDVIVLDLKPGLASITRKRPTPVPSLDVLESTGTRNIDLPSRFQSMAGASDLRISVQGLLDGIDRLSGMPLFSKTGGNHNAILFSSSGESFAAEDLGRHNSVDKAIGGGLRKRIPLNSCWLAVSGRIPSDMILKVCMAHIPLIASVSAPTCEGIRAGERAGVTVIGFTRHGRFNCYSHAERITS